MSKKIKVVKLCPVCGTIQRIGYKCGICGNFVEDTEKNEEKQEDAQDSKRLDGMKKNGIIIDDDFSTGG